MEAIDRGNPCGKRDYAIILLITRLGLRGVDVKRLEFADFDWPGNRLFVVQAKTGHRVQLPLLKEVGWAVIDYIRHGRPDCDCPQVFLRHTAPIGPFSDQDHLHQILVKHARVAHVPVSEKRRHGMHSLRHTLATRLMEGGTPVEQIADILGHQSVAVDRRLPEILAGPAGQVRAGPGRAGDGGVTMSPAITMAERDHGPGRRETRRRLQVRRRGAGAGPVRRVLPPASSPGWRRPPGPRSRRGSRRPGGAESPGDPAGLAAPVRELARWLGRRGVPAYVLPAGALPRPARYVPHIYTDQELAALFAQTDRCHY